MNVIVYTRPDGGISVVVPAEKARLPQETESAFLARVIALSVPADASNIFVCDEADIPTDRTFRNAWAADGGTVLVHMDRARDIHMDRIRAVRSKALAALDLAYQRADEQADAKGKSAIAARKQALRDIPQTFALDVQTPEELKALWPDSLPQDEAGSVGQQ